MNNLMGLELGYGSMISWDEKEREYQRKALALVGDVSPYYNIAPIIELVRLADGLGFDLVRRADSAKGEK